MRAGDLVEGVELNEGRVGIVVCMYPESSKLISWEYWGKCHVIWLDNNESMVVIPSYLKILSSASKKNE